MITYLKPREHYAELYDNITIELCRDNEQMLRDVYKKSKEKGLPKLTGKDKDKDPEHEMMKVLNVFHYSMVDTLAGERWHKRTEAIDEMMAKDEAKDQQLRDARLREEPVCPHCHKTGLRISSKDLLHQHENAKWDDPGQVLIMLECTHCKKNSAVWEDGTKFEARRPRCPKCNTKMTEKSARKNKVITDTYTCPSCGHSYKEKLDLSVKRTKKKQPEPDPYWEEDRARFLLTDEEGQKYLEAKSSLEGLKKLMDEIKEKEDNKVLYDAVAGLKKVNIGQLTETLQPAIEKAGYTELSFDKPEMSRDVYVGFNCLDTKTEREEYDSRRMLKKAVVKALEDTNWRLMSDGISYRLGYLNGRIRAYEREEDLLDLVKKNPKLMAQAKAEKKANMDKNARTIKDSKGNDIIL